MDLKLSGKTALITGGSRGIGLAVAKAMAAEGVRLHLAARTAKDLEAAKATLHQSFGADVTIHPGDGGKSETMQKLAAAVPPDLDILVNNAGAIPVGTLAQLEEPRWREAWELKLFGYINLTRTIYARMKARRKGVIINVLGAAGERPTASYIAGSTANAGLMAFTQALGGQSTDDGIRVVGVNPGLIATDRMKDMMSARAQKELGDAARWRELIGDRPFGRPGEPEEVADVVTFLASERAGYVSGTIVTVDGGGTTRSKGI
jgi:NAD(P)-dependent dehydrogenase (short-subunit alcohol dehydrogenase family)